MTSNSWFDLSGDLDVDADTWILNVIFAVVTQGSWMNFADNSQSRPQIFMKFLESWVSYQQ